MKTNRHAREAAMKLLFGYEMTGETPVTAFDDGGLLTEPGWEGTDQDRTYLDTIAKLVPEKLPEVDKIIETNSHKWKLERISKVDLALLRLALLEIEYLGVPPLVAIDEAIELSKTYSQEKSYQFVNGVLAGYLKTRQAMDEIHTSNDAER